MIRLLVAAAFATAAAVGFSAPAAADEAGFLQLQEQLNFLTVDQLRTEGYRVCQATNRGVSGADAVNMVSKDLRKTGISVSAASKIVATAITELGC
jgi:hypothetical protein